MLYEAHRGVCTEYPENTLPAFAAAIAQGFDMIELDPRFTADGVCVVHHDPTLNRTCRIADGSPLPQEQRVADTPFAELRALDAGLHKGAAFAGTKVPTLQEVLALAKKEDIAVKIDNIFNDFDPKQMAAFFEIVEQSGARVGFTCKNAEIAALVAGRFPYAEIHYDGPAIQEALEQVKQSLRHNPLTVWVRRIVITQEICSLVRQYGRLGLWMFVNAEDLAAAMVWQPDMIETDGACKPTLCSGVYNCHSHTKYSHDSNALPQEMCEAALANGLKGLAITDHCDIEYAAEMDVATPIAQSVADAAALQKEFKGRLCVFTGVELGDALFDPAAARKILALADYDVVLGSVHAVRFENYTVPFSRLDFSSMSDRELAAYMDAYFDDMLELLQTFDFDVLCHVTAPLRYIVNNQGRSVDMQRYAHKLTQILQLVIRKGIALECNTGHVSPHTLHYCPDLTVFAQYYAMGGRKITLGSDAHLPARINHHLPWVVEQLKHIGFKKACFYQKRIATFYTL